jgi:hypothetical protein
MSVAVAVFVIVAAAIGSFLIPPHRLFKTKRARVQLPVDPTVSAMDEEHR